jgi:hypothetical protein
MLVQDVPRTQWHPHCKHGIDHDGTFETESDPPPDAARCKNRPTGPDSWRNLKINLEVIFLLKSTA